MKSRRLLSAAIVATLVLGTYQAYAYDENFKGYEAHNISVKADAAKDEYGNTITEQNVDYALSLSFTENDDQILEIDKDIICRTIMGKPVKPKTLGQKHYVDSIRKKMIVFGIGPAGTGKTILPWLWPSRLLKTGK